MPDLTARQGQTLVIVRQYIGEHGYGPSEREIAESMGIGRHSVRQHLTALERQGLIERIPAQARSIRVCQPMA
jgi:repressor LexA